LTVALPVSKQKLISTLALGVFFATGVSVAAPPLRPVAPILYEKPGGVNFEIVWFHPSFHRRHLTNIADSTPGPGISPTLADNQSIVATRVAITPPVSLWSVSALFSAEDPYPSEPGDQFSSLLLQVTRSRDTVTAHPTDLSIRLLDSNTALPSFGIAYPSLGFDRGKEIYLGLQWAAGFPQNPRLIEQGGLGQLKSQEIVFATAGGDAWSNALDRYPVEATLLDWRPSAQNESDGGTDHLRFSLWYMADTTQPLAQAWSGGVVGTDTLSWSSTYKGPGFMKIVAELDTGVGSSDTVIASIDGGSFGKLTFSSPQLTFDWSAGAPLSQTLAITNHATYPVTVTIQSTDAALAVDSPSVTINGASFKIVRVRVTSPPAGSRGDRYALIFSSDTTWTPVKLDVLSLPDIQTDVDDDDEPVKPTHFSVSEVYPNPMHGFATLKVAAPVRGVYRVEIYNLLGQLLQAQDLELSGEVSLDIRLDRIPETPLATGVYLVRVSSDDESQMRKFVLVK